MCLCSFPILINGDVEMKPHGNRCLSEKVLITALALQIIAVMGCQSTPPAKTADVLKQAPPTRITLKAGDVIDIKFAYASQFNETQTIRPDGKVELLLVGEVVAEGKTPSELRDELIKLYSAELQHPQLAVVVRTLQDRRVYIGGEVNKPGLIEMPGEMTALEAIIQAGGFNMDAAEPASVIVVRCDEEGKQQGYRLNLKDALKGMEGTPFYLEPRDIVYVPRTTIANVDQWVAQHIWKLLPSISAGYAF